MNISKFTTSGDYARLGATRSSNIRQSLLRLTFAVVVLGSLCVNAALGSQDLSIYTVVIFGVIVLLANSIVSILAFTTKNSLPVQKALSVAQVCLDILLVVGLLIFIETQVMMSAILFIIPLLTASSLLSTKGVRVVAAASLIAYIAVLIAMTAVSDVSSLDILYLAVSLVMGSIIIILLWVFIRNFTSTEAVVAKENTYDNFLSVLGHELKHPSSASRTILDAWEHSGVEMSDEIKRFVAMLQDENEKMIRLVDNLIEFSPNPKIVKLREKINLVDMVQKSAEKAADNADRPDDILSLKGADRVEVEVNALRVNLALINIFSNAFECSRKGQKVEYQVADAGEFAEVVIKNSGEGMSNQEIQDEIDRYKRQGIQAIKTDKENKLGFGLYAASRIALAHGGSIELKSIENIGMVIIFRIKKAGDEEVAK